MLFFQKEQKDPSARLTSPVPDKIPEQERHCLPSGSSWSLRSSVCNGQFV